MENVKDEHERERERDGERDRDRKRMRTSSRSRQEDDYRWHSSRCSEYRTYDRNDRDSDRYTSNYSSSRYEPDPRRSESRYLESRKRERDYSYEPVDGRSQRVRR